MAETDQIRRWVTLFDVHYPHCIPAFFDVNNPKKKTPVLRFLRDFNPDILTWGGDQLDLDVISYWNQNKARIKEGKRLKQEYEGANRMIDAVDAATPKATERNMHEGNHDARVQDLLDEQPAFEGLVEIPINLQLKTRGYKWFPSRTVSRIGKLHIIHGDYKRGILPLNHSRMILGIFARNMLYGHVHSNQSATSTSPIDTHPMEAHSVGTLAHVNPYWRRNEVSSWVNSFACGYVFPNGNFHVNIINIINNGFIFDGQVYK